MMRKSRAAIWKLCWIALFAVSGAATAQTIPDTDLLVRRSTYRVAEAALTRSGVSRDMCTSLYEDYRAAFDGARLAKDASLNWTFQQADLARHRPFDKTKDDDTLAIELRWQIGARDLTEDLLDHFRALAPTERAVMDSVERAHLRAAMMRSAASSPESAQLADLPALLQAIDPAAADRPEVALILDEHTREIDVHLRRADHHMMTFQTKFRPHRRVIQEARIGDVPGLRLKLEAALQFMLRRSTEMVVLRGSILRALQQLHPVLPDDVFAQLRASVERALYSIVFRGDAAFDGQIRAALEAPDLTDAQHQALLEVRANFDRAAAAAVSGLGPLYDRTLAPAHLEHVYRASVFATVRKPELAAIAEAAQAAAAKTDTAFEEALQRWRIEARTLAREIENIMGRAVAPGATVVAPADPDDDAAAPVHSWESQIAPIFAPFCSQALVHERIAGLPASSQTAVQSLYDNVTSQYALGRARFDAELQQVRAKQQAFENANPGADVLQQGIDVGHYAVFSRWFATRLRLERQFDTDVVALLDPSDGAVWAAQCVAIRRSRILNEVRARATMDLVEIAASLPLLESERESLAEPQRAYVVELNDALVMIEDRSNDLTKRLQTSAVSNPDMSEEDIQRTRREAAQEWTSLIGSVPAINERAIITFAGHLAPDSRERLMNAFRRAKYPVLYTPTPVESAFTALLSPQCAPLLAAEQIHELDALRGRYLEAQSALQARTVAALDDWESPARQEEWGREREAYRAVHGDADAFDSNNPIAPLVQARYELVKTTAATMRGLLGDAALSRFPLSVQISLCPSDYFLEASRLTAPR